MKRLILYLIRKRLGIRKGQKFQFINQVSDTDYYMFTDSGILKFYHLGRSVKTSSVSLNWLLDKECKIRILEND